MVCLSAERKASKMAGQLVGVLASVKVCQTVETTADQLVSLMASQTDEKSVDWKV